MPAVYEIAVEYLCPAILVVYRVEPVFKPGRIRSREIVRFAHKLIIGGSGTAFQSQAFVHIIDVYFHTIYYLPMIPKAGEPCIFLLASSTR